MRFLSADLLLKVPHQLVVWVLAKLFYIFGVFALFLNLESVTESANEYYHKSVWNYVFKWKVCGFYVLLFWRTSFRALFEFRWVKAPFLQQRGVTSRRLCAQWTGVLSNSAKLCWTNSVKRILSMSDLHSHRTAAVFAKITARTANPILETGNSARISGTVIK